MASLALVSLSLFAAASAAVPREARACGGTFCDLGPQTTPVAQTAENVLFVLDGPSVEAHIQIQYDPNTTAANFAWVIPVSGIPDFAVGSDPLFSSLLSGSAPRYRLQTGATCDGGDDPGGGGFGFIRQPDVGGGDVDIELQETVGALDITVLSGGSGAEVTGWLNANGFQQPASASPIFEAYVAQGWYFAAIRLTQSAGLDEIHPLVMRYTSGEPCVPLRLTRVASADDMDVRTFFLGDGRIAPTNYRHVLVNPLKIDWLNEGDNYKEVVTLAVDADGAGGKAFVTEYAGGSDTVNASGIYDEAWVPEEFLGVEPSQVIVQLQAQGLADCGRFDCEFSHPLVAGLLRRYLPPPRDIEELAYWAGLADVYADLIDLEVWDEQGFVDDFRQRIVDPALAATELLDTWPYLTRMYTTVSPHEMTSDPVFHHHESLPDVPWLHTAVQDFECDEDGGSVVTLPDGRQVRLAEGSAWPDFTDEMPWEEEVAELMPGGGAPMVLVDNTELIDELLEQWNADPTPPPPGGSDTGGTSGGGDGDTTGGAAGEGPGGDGGPGAGPGGAQDEGGDDGDGEKQSGCTCRSRPADDGTLTFAIGLLLALVVRRRRAHRECAAAGNR